MVKPAVPPSTTTEVDKLVLIPPVVVMALPPMFSKMPLPVTLNALAYVTGAVVSKLKRLATDTLPVPKALAAPPTIKLPVDTVVTPEWLVLAPVKVNVPEPDLVKPPVPAITPA